MASSGYFSNTFRTGYTLRVEWKINSQSIANNTSSVTVTAYLVSGGSSYTINSSAKKTIELTINGTTYTRTLAGLASLDGNQKKSLFSKTVTIAHSSDGTKNIAISCEFAIKVTLSGTYFSTVKAPVTGTATAALDTIPRATTPTTSGTFNVGNRVTINTPRLFGSFTHILQYSVDGTTYKTIASDVGTSVNWTLPAELAEVRPNATSGKVYIKCRTYYNGNLIGSKVITRTYYIAASYAAPTVSLAISQENDADIAQYVRGRSRVTLSVTGAFQHGASAKKYVFTYGGATKTISTASDSASVTFTLPSNAAASFAYSVVLTDSRGYTSSKSGTVATAAYTAPVITAFDVARGSYDGEIFTEDQKGNSLKIVAAGTISSLSNANSKTYTIEYRLSNSIDYVTLVDKESSAYAVAFTEITEAIFSENASYVVRLTLSDSFDSVSQIVDVPSQKVLLNFSPDGKAMAIGGIANVDNAMEIMLEAYMTGGIRPMQLANGTDFDEIVKSGVYIGNASSGGYINAPLASGTFVLDVTTSGPVGQLMQRYSYCHKTEYRAFVRFYYSSAWGDWQPTEGFTEDYTTNHAGRVRLANGFMVQWGRLSIVPDAANQTKIVAVKFPVAYVHAPIVHAHPNTSVPHIINVSAGNLEADGFEVFLNRTNTTSTLISWIAVGRG